MYRMRPAPFCRVFTLGIAALVFGGCIDYLPPGEHGSLRYFSEVDGDAPLPMLPPISDRDGNAYVLYGAPDESSSESFQAFTGGSTGGWNGGCSILRNREIRLGARAWVGAATSRAWYWAGEGLIEVAGRTGSCRVILPKDPASQVDLFFLGVIPRVYETPSRTFVHALLRGGGDVFHVTVDLERDDYGDARPFEPEGATDVRVLGTGADRSRNLGFMLVSYELDGARILEGIHLDRNNNEIARARLDDVPGELAESLGDGAVYGNLESADGNLVAGYLETGDVVLFDRAGGVIRSVPDLTPHGVHRWEDELYVVGVSSGEPHISRITPGGEFFSTPVLWESSLRAASELEGTVSVLDDRREPRRVVGWESPVSAMSEHPFVQPWSPHPYAEGTTVWIVAGPSFEVAGIQRTSVAHGPLGISYP